MKDYIKYLKTSVWGKVTLVLLILILDLGLYNFMKLGSYLPGKYIIMAAVAFVAILVGLWFAHRKIAKIAAVLEVIVCAALIVGVVASNRVEQFAKGVTGIAKQYETVSIIALKDSKYTKNSDFSKLKLGYLISDPNAYTRGADILNTYNKNVKKMKAFTTMEKEWTDFKAKKTELLVLTNISASAMEDIDDTYESQYKVLLSKKYELQTIKTKAVDPSTTPFTVYIQGIDMSSHNKINSTTARADVNILLTVNPKTLKVNMQVLPRDSYVYIKFLKTHSKLTWSNWWGGMQSAIQSIHDTFGVDVNYYAKIDFSGFVDLVDALGGVNAYSHYTYTSFDSIHTKWYHFKKGYNKLNGNMALAFVRERKTLPNDERSRGLQQMELIKAIFKKFASNPTYSRALSVMDTVQDNCATNVPKKYYYKTFQVVKAVLPQLQTMQLHSIEGTVKTKYEKMLGTYKHPYVLNKKSVKEAKDRIDAVLNGK